MAFAHGHALIIGVGRYQHDPGANVPIAIDDARAVSQILQQPGICGYPPDQVHMITDGSATKEGILLAIDELAQRAGQEDTVFLFYCGHGAYGTDENYYLVSHDAHIKGARVVTGTGVSDAELLLRLRQLHSRRVLMVFNTCYSGKISPALGTDISSFVPSNLPETSSTAILATGSGRIIITASRESQKSFIGRGELSIFTQALVEGLGGEGVRNNAGFVSAYDLYEYIYYRVTRTARDLLQKNQEPELTVLKGIGPFAVSLYRGSDELGGFTPEQIPASQANIHSVDPEDARRMFERIVVNTEGGAFVEGDIHTGGGSFVGRDQIIKGDHVGGSQISGDQISIGGIFNSNVAVGRGARAYKSAPLKNSEREGYFAKLNQIAQNAPSEVRQQAIENTEKLVNEIEKGNSADDTELATTIKGLVELVPQAAGMISQMFSDPQISWIAGDVTRFVLKNYQ